MNFNLILAARTGTRMTRRSAARRKLANASSSSRRKEKRKNELLTFHLAVDVIGVSSRADCIAFLVHSLSRADPLKAAIVILSVDFDLLLNIKQKNNVVHGVTVNVQKLHL